MFSEAIFIGGPTASKKTELAFKIQSAIPSYIVNADSMQVYDKLKILTNRPNLNLLKKHDSNLFSFVNYPKKCNVGFWQKECLSLMKNKKDKIPIFVGGTGLYIDSLINNISQIPAISKNVKKITTYYFKKKGKAYLYEKLKNYDKEISKKISPNDTQRIIRAIQVRLSTGKKLSEWHAESKEKIFKKFIYIVIKTDRDVLFKRVNNRCAQMIKTGVLEEIELFQKKKLKVEHPLHKSIGLEALSNYIKGICSIDDALANFSLDTRRYAKRQLTWFNNKARSATHLEYSKVKEYILKNLKL